MLAAGLAHCEVVTVRMLCLMFVRLPGGLASTGDARGAGPGAPDLISFKDE